MDIKIFLIIFGGIGGLAVLFRIIFGFIPKGDELWVKTTKVNHEDEFESYDSDSTVILGADKNSYLY
jgi:hypothetical protein